MVQQVKARQDTMHEYMVTGRKVKNKPDASNAVLGSLHQLPDELTNSLIVTGR